MHYAVTAIEFDFNDDLDPIYSIPKEDQDLITREPVSYTHLTLPTMS